MEDVSADEVASYIETLNLSLESGEIKRKEVISVLSSLPSPEHVKRHLSDEEAKVLFESVRWVWKEVSGKDIVETFNVTPAPLKTDVVSANVIALSDDAEIVANVPEKLPAKVPNEPAPVLNVGAVDAVNIAFVLLAALPFSNSILT